MSILHPTSNLVYKNKMQVLINLDIKVNVITLEYALKPGLNIHSTSIEVLKIDSSIFKTLEIVLTSF